MDTNNREHRGRVLHMTCPIGLLCAATPWGMLPEREREAWRVLGDAADRWYQPTPTHTLLATVLDQSSTIFTAELTATLLNENHALRRYARHLDGCPQAPCACGLAALLDPPA